MTHNHSLPKVGVGVFLLKDDKILMFRRKGTHGEGSWTIMGGHLEMGESIVDCARREAEEESGLKVTDVRELHCYTNDIFEEKHYVTFYCVAEYRGAEEPSITEPESQSEMDWFSWDSLPQPLFFPLQNFLKLKINPFEARKQSEGAK
jgi:8-oxo-dGTP diphosphatase